MIMNFAPVWHWFYVHGEQIGAIYALMVMLGFIAWLGIEGPGKEHKIPLWTVFWPFLVLIFLIRGFKIVLKELYRAFRD